MIRSQQWAERTPGLIVAAILLIFGFLGYQFMGQESFVRTALSGLTLGSLYFMVAAGLTIIFGLMDVLNFAHGAMFMAGAYMGWQFYTNPTFIFGVLPLLLAFSAGLMTSESWVPLAMRMNVPERYQPHVRAFLILGGLVLIVLGFWGLDLLDLAKTAMVAATVAGNPLAEASQQEALAIFWRRPLLIGLGGILLAMASARPGDKTQIVHNENRRKRIIWLSVLLVLIIVSTLVREQAAVAVLLMNGNLRFVLALVVGAGVGAALGAVVEMSLIRPLYARPFYLVLVTLGLGYVLREVVQLLWGPVAYAMARPPWFSQPGKAENMLAWFTGNNVTINIMGVTFPSYRLFIIFLGILMLVVLSIVLKYTRLGIIIRAGVQDRQMVEALGINVKQVFTIVFALGIGLAALGGIGAAPFVPVQQHMGDVYQMQGFIVVVIGGMGSYGGAAIGALLLGMARAFGDYLALTFSLSPAIAEASTVIIMALVLLVRPSGIFGKKE
jgi:branched-chain amino acid transport system permease protein